MIKKRCKRRNFKVKNIFTLKFSILRVVHTNYKNNILTGKDTEPYGKKLLFRPVLPHEAGITPFYSISCLWSHNFCLLSHIYCLKSLVWLMSPVCLLSTVCLMSPVCLLSHVCLSSPVYLMNVSCLYLVSCLTLIYCQSLVSCLSLTHHIH